MDTLGDLMNVQGAVPIQLMAMIRGQIHTEFLSRNSATNKNLMQYLCGKSIQKEYTKRMEYKAPANGGRRASEPMPAPGAAGPDAAIPATKAGVAAGGPAAGGGQGPAAGAAHKPLPQRNGGDAPPFPRDGAAAPQAMDVDGATPGAGASTPPRGKLERESPPKSSRKLPPRKRRPEGLYRPPARRDGLSWSSDDPTVACDAAAATEKHEGPPSAGAQEQRDAADQQTKGEGTAAVPSTKEEAPGTDPEEALGREQRGGGDAGPSEVGKADAGPSADVKPNKGRTAMELQREIRELQRSRSGSKRHSL